MIELKNKKQFEQAVERAKADRKNLLVQLTGVSRRYQVINRGNGNIYTVTFQVTPNGKRLGHCTCIAGEQGKICKHLAAAAGLNVCLAEKGLLAHQSANSV